MEFKQKSKEVESKRKTFCTGGEKEMTRVL